MFAYDYFNEDDDDVENDTIIKTESEKMKENKEWIESMEMKL